MRPQFTDVSQMFSSKPDHLQDPVDLEAKRILEYQKNPFAFIQTELGVSCEAWKDDIIPPTHWNKSYWPLWSKQREIFTKLVKHKKVVIKSCHASGKTFTAGMATIYLTAVFRAMGLTTAPGYRQVRRLLWGEIHSLYYKAPRPLGGKLTQTAWDLGPKWFVEGFATDHPEVNFTGFHEESCFVVIDEAGGVTDDVYDMIDTILTSENSYVLAIGNPIDATSEFKNMFEPGSGYAPITISAWDTPNVKAGYNLYPKLVAFDWPQRMKEKWGEDDPWYQSRVLGEFPTENHHILIKQGHIEQALQRELAEDYPFCLSCDVARSGSDQTKVGIRWASGKFRILDTIRKSRNTDVAGVLKECYRKYEQVLHHNKDISHELFVNVDDTGCGGGVTDILIESDIPTNGIVSAASPDDTQDDSENFANLRSQAFWNLKNAFELGYVDIDDKEIARQLSKLERRPNSRDKIFVTDKATLKSRLRGKSPDEADCMMLAWAKDYVDVDGELVRFL
jgi:hypothetical protein